MTILCIIPGPSHEYRREPDRVRWCFHCRAHLMHDAVLIGDPPDVLTYYENQWVLECSRCKGDHTYFPGCGPL